MIRRTLLLASMIVFFWAGSASAQTYGEILGGGQTNQPPSGQTNQPPSGQTNEQPRVLSSSSSGQRAGTGARTSSGSAAGNLARTGQDNIEPLIQASIVLIGGGVLLVLASRRRSAARRLAA